MIKRTLAVGLLLLASAGFAADDPYAFGRQKHATISAVMRVFEALEALSAECVALRHDKKGRS